MPNHPLPIDLELFESMFRIGIPYARMAVALGFTEAQIQRWAHHRGYRRNKYVPHAHREYVHPDDPTPDELRQRMLEVQSRWSESVREQRLVTKSPRWKPPLAELQGLADG